MSTAIEAAAAPTGPHTRHAMTRNNESFRSLQVVIAVLTFRRHRDLAELLPCLREHVRASSVVRSSILVVDNDESPSARDLVRTFDEVRYVHEPRPGIAAARNRAMDESGDARLLVFIDDDERPSERWLEQLLTCWDWSGAAAVAGPVLSVFDGDVDPWIDAGGFFQRRRHPTGTIVPVAATNNLLLDLDVVRRHGLHFDERFGTSGGSDTFFTQTITRSGETIVWCDEAVVYDVVPSHRLTRGWVLKRAERLGNSESRVALLSSRSRRERLMTRSRQCARGAARVILGAALSARGQLLHDHRSAARGARAMARGRGMVGGAFGHVVAEYERSDEQEGGV